MVLALLVVLTATAVPPALSRLNDARAAAAARFLGDALAPHPEESHGPS